MTTTSNFKFSFILLFLLYLSPVYSDSKENFVTHLINSEYENSQACFGSTCFDVEVVYTPNKISRGLMHREHLDANSGMLFIFPIVKVYPFWMKNTLIPLDIIWLTSNNKIVHISHNVQPCKSDPCPTYNPIHPSLYVLELNAGLAKKYNISIGDYMTIRKNKE